MEARKTLAPWVSITVSSAAGAAAMDSPNPSTGWFHPVARSAGPTPSGIWFLVTSALMAWAAASVTVSMPQPEMVGCADLIRGWPIPSTALIGLLLLDEAHQGHGLGRSAYQAVEAKVRRWPEIDILRVSVVRSSAAVLPFWRRVGFIETGEVRPYVYDKLLSESIILAKPLHDDEAERLNSR